MRRGVWCVEANCRRQHTMRVVVEFTVAIDVANRLNGSVLNKFELISCQIWISIWSNQQYE